MELFGTKFTLALGAWRLRFVCMLEEAEEIGAPARRSAPHHIVVRPLDSARDDRSVR
jgi:hypothetical protein